MAKHGTASQVTGGQVTGGYIEFQAAVLRALPRNIDSDVALYWTRNGEELARVLHKLLRPAVCWREEDGVIYFEVTSDGTPGHQWIERLEQKGFRLTRWAKDVLKSPDFNPSSGVTYRVSVLKGTVFTDTDRMTRKIRAEAERRKLAKPHPEVACLIRELFSDKELEQMGLWWIVVFHEPIKDSDPGPFLLFAGRGSEGRWLGAGCGRSDDCWCSGGGFAFVVPQVL